MLKYSKYNSVQGGPFSNINRMVDLEIPEGIQINPSQSFVQFVVNLDGTSAFGIKNYCPKLTGRKVIPYNVDLIRNASLTGDKVGRLEDIRRVNILNHNILELSKGTIEKMCLVDSLYQAKDYNNGLLLSPFVEFHKDGNVPSEYIQAYLRIPLSHLFSLGDLQILDTSKTGKLRIHLELDKLEYLEVEDVYVLPFYNGDNIINDRKFEDLTAGGAIIVNGMVRENLQNSPYYVGQPLSFAYTPQIGGDNQPPEQLDTTISAISYSSATGLLTITLAEPFPDMTGDVDLYTNITASERGLMETPTLNVATCELGVAQYSVNQPSPDVLNYTTFTTEEYSAGNNSLFLNKVFEIEPNCINAMLMFKDDDSVNASNPLSNNPHLESYRMRIDNQDVYDRDINTNYLTGRAIKHHLSHDSLHYDSINRTFLNASIPLRNLTMMAMIRNEVAYSNEMRFTNDDDIGYENKIMILATPTPLTATTKKLQFNLSNKVDDEVNIKGVILYKQCVRSVKM